MPTLNWLTREQDIRAADAVPYRLLEEVPDLGVYLADDGNTATNEKRVIGELWERQSKGKALFLILEKQVDGKDMRAQMIEKIASS